MIKLSLLTVALFSSITANAAYIIKIPMEQKLGGSLPTRSIAFVGGNVGGSTPPVTPEPEPKPEEPVRPEEPTRESVCITAKKNVTSIAAAQGLDLRVTYIYPLPADKCVLMVQSIGKFTDKDSLVKFGSSVSSLNIVNYSIGVERYSSTTLDTFISSATTDVYAQADKLWSRYLIDKK